MNDWNQQIIDEFRANGGKVAQFGDAPLVVLSTIGAKSGATREIPLVSQTDEDGRPKVVFASAAGAPKHPDWYFNLKANPEITVEFRDESFGARLDEMGADEATAALQKQAEIMPQFGEYVTSAAPRVIPSFSITPTAGA